MSWFLLGCQNNKVTDVIAPVSLASDMIAAVVIYNGGDQLLGNWIKVQPLIYTLTKMLTASSNQLKATAQRHSQMQYG